MKANDRPKAAAAVDAFEHTTSDRELSGLIDWSEDALEAIATGDLQRARRDVSALRGWLLAKAGRDR